MRVKILILTLISVILTACAPGRPIDRTRAVGVDTALGQTLTNTKWCTPASTDDVNRTKFTTLDLRFTGKFFRSVYSLNDDHGMNLESKEEGTWALVFDKLFTHVEGNPRQVEAKVSLVEDTDVARLASAKTATRHTPAVESSCARLSVFGADPETFCPCDFVKN